MTATDQSALADEFEAHRDRLRLLAIRLLGSPDEADDVLQETWVRLSHAQTRETTIVNLGGWVTTVASRVCVDTMRRTAARREVSVGDRLETLRATATDQSPAELALAAETVTPALLAVLDKLSPLERVAFVHPDSRSTAGSTSMTGLSSSDHPVVVLSGANVQAAPGLQPSAR